MTSPSPDRVKLTVWQRRQLDVAAHSTLGVVDCHHMNGLARASWHARMTALTSRGLFQRYVHGGYEITPAGRRALQEQEK